MDQEKHLPLAPRDLLILSSLAEGPLHGYGIIKTVEARSNSGVLLDPANLYRVLRRMRRVGWIQEATDRESGQISLGETMEDPRKHEDRRKTYKVTTVGRAILMAELARLERLLRYARPAIAGGPSSSGTQRGR